MVILLLLCLAGGTCCGLWLNFYMVKLPVPFLPLSQFQTAGEMLLAGAEPDPFYQAILAFWSNVIILQVIIPLSLYVKIELARLVQIFQIHHDPVTGKRIECRALNILKAICNTVVVAKQSHRDHMNEVGQIETSPVVVGGAYSSNQAVHIINQQALDDTDGSLSVISERDSALSLDPNSISLIVPRPVTTSTPSSTPGNVTPKRPGNLFFFSGIEKGFCMPSALIFLLISQKKINFKCNHIKIVYISRTASGALPTNVSAAERTNCTVTNRLVCRNNTVRVSSASSLTALLAIAQSSFSPFFL